MTGIKPYILPIPNSETLSAVEKTYAAYRLFPDWSCPSCGRDLTQITRWYRGKQKFFCGVVRHHDHSDKRDNGRFPVTLICQDCNEVDGRVKCNFRDLQRKDWSFSPSEIGNIVLASPHQKHEIDFNRAYEIASHVIAHNFAPGQQMRLPF